METKRDTRNDHMARETAARARRCDIVLAKRKLGHSEYERAYRYARVSSRTKVLGLTILQSHLALTNKRCDDCGDCIASSGPLRRYCSKCRAPRSVSAGGGSDVSQARRVLTNKEYDRAYVYARVSKRTKGFGLTILQAHLAIMNRRCDGCGSCIAEAGPLDRFCGPCGTGKACQSRYRDSQKREGS